MIPDEGLQKFLSDRGGRNLYGDPLYRLVWSEDRMCIRHGEFNDFNESGDLLRTVVEARQVRKYGFARNRWIIERWHPAEYYGSPEGWEAENSKWEGHTRVHALGEYPSRGDYELLDVVEVVGRCECGNEVTKPCPVCHKQTSFLEPTRAYLEEILQLVAAAKERGEMAAGAMARAIDEKTRQAMFNNYYHRFRSAMRAFDGTKHASFAGLAAPGATPLIEA